MKKIFAVVVLSFILWGCSNQGHSENKGADTAAESGHQHETNMGNPGLNNGAKWKADTATLSNVALLKTIVSTSKNDSPENYILTAAEFQDGLNKMIQDCNMKGPGHDALHRWLEPLLEETNVLKSATKVENARETLHKIEEQLNLFTQYFE